MPSFDGFGSFVRGIGRAVALGAPAFLGACAAIAAQDKRTGNSARRIARANAIGRIPGIRRISFPGPLSNDWSIVPQNVWMDEEQNSFWPRGFHTVKARW